MMVVAFSAMGGTEAYDELGRPVALSNGRAIVAAYEESGGDGDPLDGAGAAYVFEY